MSRPVDLFATNPLRRTHLSHIVSYFSLVSLLTLPLTALAHPPVALKPDAHAARWQDPPATSLETSKPIERELAGGDAHPYQISLAAGQYARVVVDQRRINVALSVTDAEGKKIADADMFPIGDSELVSLVAATATTYRVNVRAPDKTAPKGSYEIKIKVLRPATERDKSAVAGESLMAEATSLVGQPTPESWRKAIEKYQQAVPLFKAAQEPAWEATALYLIGSIYTGLREKQKALEFSERALPVAEAAAQQTGAEERRLGIKVKAIALTIMGQAQVEFGDKKKALELFNQALVLNREIKDRSKQIDALNLLALTHQLMGDYREALNYLSQQRQLLTELGDRYKEALLLNNMCVIKSDLGEYKSAIEFCNQALVIRRDLNDRLREALVLNNLGNGFSNLGEYQNALDSYNRAYAIYKDLGKPRDRGIALNNIAWVYGTLGERQKAIDVYNQALEIFRSDRDQYREANVLSNIAVNYAAAKDFRQALTINLQVLPLRLAANDREGQAVTLGNIANCHSHLGDKEKALDNFNQSIELFRTLNPRQLANALRNIGALYRELGQHQKALNYLNEGLQLTRTIGDRNGESATLAQMARVERDRGNLLAASKFVGQALEAIESLRINVKSQQLRASFFASVRDYHELNIDLLMRLHKERPSEGFDVAALQASEKGRARSLLEMLKEAAAEIRQGVDPSLVERERILRQTISDKAERQTRMLSGNHTEEQATAAASEIDALTADYEQVQAGIRQTSPRYAALTQPAPLSLKEIQSQLLDEDTLLLEYVLGEEKSFVWAVTPTSIESFELPGRAVIEAAARRVYDLITASDRQAANESAAQKRKRLDQSDADYPVAAAALSRILLQPVASTLGNRRLLIVGEGMLQYVPFAALPEPPPAPKAQPVLGVSERGVTKAALPSKGPRTAGAGPEVTADLTPLIANHEVVCLPSASVLGSLRQEAMNRQRPTKTVAVFADPVFDQSDARLALARQGPPAPEVQPARRNAVRESAAESGLNSFARLRFTRQEAEQIVRLASEDQSLKELDFAANRAKATGNDLGQYRIVHFATHGLINNQHAELSGIVLSLVDEQGRPQNGFLRIYDIYNMNLKADLVVLSACQTALGKDIKSEGLVGLTRAFMYAGATRVVASLWQTEDRGTAALMGRFYEGMLAGHLSPTAALRKAQISMWKDKRWRHPRYWAAFTLQGEWK